MTRPKIDKIIRSRRKTLSLEITRDARLIIRAPERTSLEFIENVVFKKRLWIQRKQSLVKQKYQRTVQKEFVNGEGFLYLGDTYKLYIIDEGSSPLSFEHEFRLVRNYIEYARELFIDWYKKQANEKILERVNWYATLSGISYNNIRITDAKRRWGSCSAKGNLSFSWRIIMAPLAVVDYVVVHELIHFKEKNHSQSFWDKVKVMLPNYKRYKNWLKENGYLLTI